MKAVRIHLAARREAREAAVWYAERSPVLMDRFLAELLAAISSAAANPLQYPAYLHETRRVMLKKFPYLLVFLDLPDKIFVDSIAHAKRNPGYWKSRIHGASH